MSMEKHSRTPSSSSLLSKRTPQPEDYIKICLPEEGEELDWRHPIIQKYQSQRYEQKVGKRFTFNRLNQDAIKEDDEQQFYKVDFDQIIQLKNQLNSIRNENIRLVQQSTHNMHNFNRYILDMEKKVAEKNEEIQCLKYRIINMEQKLLKNEEELRKFQLKALPQLKNRSISRMEYGTQCQSKPIFKLNGRILCTQQPNQQSFFNSKDIRIRVLEKENIQMHKDITKLKQNQQYLTESLEKQSKSNKMPAEGNITPYSKTLNNSPRASLRHKNKSIVTENIKLEFNGNSCLNALISPRASQNYVESYHPNAKQERHELLLNNIESKIDRLICRSACMKQGNILQFDRIGRTRYARPLERH